MSKTASSSLFPDVHLAALESFRLPEKCLRLLWCQSKVSPGLIFCARQQSPEGPFQMEHQAWKIATMACQTYDRDGNPVNPRQIGFISASLTRIYGTRPTQVMTDVMTRAEMIGWMSNVYSPSTSDPMKRLPTHFSHELALWQREEARRLQRVQADLNEQRHEALKAGGPG